MLQSAATVQLAAETACSVKTTQLTVKKAHAAVIPSQAERDASGAATVAPLNGTEKASLLHSNSGLELISNGPPGHASSHTSSCGLSQQAGSPDSMLHPHAEAYSPAWPRHSPHHHSSPSAALHAAMQKAASTASHAPCSTSVSTDGTVMQSSNANAVDSAHAAQQATSGAAPATPGLVVEAAASSRAHARDGLRPAGSAGPTVPYVTPTSTATGDAAISTPSPLSQAASAPPASMTGPAARRAASTASGSVGPGDVPVRRARSGVVSGLSARMQQPNYAEWTQQEFAAGGLGYSDSWARACGCMPM